MSGKIAGLLVMVTGGVLLAQSAQRPTFRAASELILVDVQVVDRTGTPILGLGPEDFEVRLDRQERRVVSAELIQYGSPATDVTRPTAGSRADRTSPDTLAPVTTAGRNFVLAIDESSFHARNALAAMQAARRFIENLNPTDTIGLFPFPVYPETFTLTTDHESVLAQIDHIVGVLDPLPPGQFFLTLGEVIDITAGDEDVLGRVARRECPSAPGPCRRPIAFQAQGMAISFEAQVNMSTQGLTALFDAIKDSPERTIVVLVSGGLLAGDRVGGRPDVNTLVDDIARQAAQSNATLMVLHMDTSFIDAFSPRGGGLTASFMRDSAALGAGLERFAGSAGGALIRVQAGTGDYAFERVLRETSAYYLLGVEPGADERDGQPHYISVKVDVRGAEVRSRTMVVIPAGG